MKEYTWIAPNGVRVVSCKPYREDEWIKGGTLGFLRHAYPHIAKIVFWSEPRRDLRLWLAKRGVNPSLACRLAGHVYNHMTKICFCGEVKL